MQQLLHVTTCKNKTSMLRNVEKYTSIHTTKYGGHGGCTILSAAKVDSTRAYHSSRQS